MKRVLLVVFTLWLALTVRAAAEEPVITVLPFRGGQSIPCCIDREAFLQTLTDTLTDKLVAQGGVRVVERSRLLNVLGELLVAYTPEFDQATAARVGKQVGAQAVLVPTLRTFQTTTSGLGFFVAGFGVRTTTATVELGARIVSVETGEILTALESSGRHTGAAIDFSNGQLNFQSQEFRESAAGRALDQALSDLARQVPDAVKKVLAEKDARKPTAKLVQLQPIAVIDAGRASGIRPGMKLFVYKTVSVPGLSKPLRVKAGEVEVLDADEHAAVVTIRPLNNLEPAVGDEVAAE